MLIPRPLILLVPLALAGDVAGRGAPTTPVAPGGAPEGGPAPVHRLAVEAQAPDAARALAAARRGGTTILCRHAITGSFREREPVDYDDPGTQRRLSSEGERQSRTMGRAIREAGVEITELVASPMARAHRTASLMFGREPAIDSVWHTNGGSYGGPARDRRREILATPPASGNRLIVSHIGTMESVLPDGLGSIGEGDCVVVRAREGGEGFDVLGVVPWREWRGREGGAGHPSPTGR